MAREVSTDFLRIDLTDGKTRKVISACQSDTIQRTLHFLVVNAGKPLDLTNLFYAEIIVKRTDGTYLDNACVIDGNDIQYTLKSTDVAVIGENEAHLLLSFKDGTVKETPTFYLNVFSTFYNPSAIQSQSEYTALVNKVLDAQEAANDALESKNAAIAAATDAADSADEAGSYVETVSLYTSEAGRHASTAENYASEAESILASASDVASEVEAVSEYMSTTSEYLESASEYASEAQSYASDVGGYIASASEYASTAASEADKGSGYITSLSTTGDEYISSLSSMASEYASTEVGYLTSTSEYASAAASEASVANSCAIVAEAAAVTNSQEIAVIKNDISWYGTCPTAASTQTKVVTTTDTKFSLVTGAKVSVKFTYNNTHATPQLNVDGKGAKAIKAYGATNPTLFWNAGDVVEFIYDGTNWIMGASLGQLYSALSEKVNTSDIVNNLTSTATNKPLSAAQGKAINDRFLFNDLIASNASETVNIKSNKLYLVAAHTTGDTKVRIGILSTVYGIHFSNLIGESNIYLNYSLSGTTATFYNKESLTIGLSITEL